MILAVVAEVRPASIGKTVGSPHSTRLFYLSCEKIVQSGEMKRNLEMGDTAIQPVPAQTAKLSISGLRFISPLFSAFALA